MKLVSAGSAMRPISTVAITGTDVEFPGTNLCGNDKKENQWRIPRL